MKHMRESSRSMNPLSQNVFKLDGLRDANQLRLALVALLLSLYGSVLGRLGIVGRERKSGLKQVSDSAERAARWLWLNRGVSDGWSKDPAN